MVWIVAGILAVIPLIIGVVASLGGMILMFSVESDYSMAAIAPLIIGLLISAAIWIGLAVWIIWWMVKQGQAGPNQHGPDPRALDTPV